MTPKHVVPLIIFVLAQSCATAEQVNPFASAQTLEQTAFASIGVSTFFLEQAARTLESQALSDGAVNAILIASEAVYTALTAADRARIGLKAVREAPDSTTDKIKAAAEALTSSLDVLSEATSALINATSATNAN